MRKALIIVLSLAMILVACSVTPFNGEGITPSPLPPASPAPEATAAPVSGGFLIYYFFPGKSQLTSTITVHPQGDQDITQKVTAKTGQVSGSIRMRAGDPALASLDPITVDLSQLASGDAQIDRIIHEQVLQTERYPTATFIAEKIEGLPDSYEAGTTIPLTITGELTIRDVTRTITVFAQAQKSGGRIIGTASAAILLSDFGLGPVDIPGILTSEDEVELELEFSAMPLVE